MKIKSALLMALLAMCMMTVAASEVQSEPEAPVATEAVSTDCWSNMGRGVINVATCFIEVPRTILYRNDQVFLWGMIGGAAEGGVRTGLRAFAGVMDIISLGFSNDGFYRSAYFAPYVWDEQWQAEPLAEAQLNQVKK